MTENKFGEEFSADCNECEGAGQVWGDVDRLKDCSTCSAMFEEDAGERLADVWREEGRFRD